MGRIKTKLMKRVTLKLFKDYKEEFKNDFNENKGIVQSHADIPSKKLKNIIAGYITRLVQQKQD